MWLFRKSRPPYALSAPLLTCPGRVTITLSDGVRSSDGASFSVFTLTPDSTPLSAALVQNAVRAWKTVRHPAVPTYVEDYESGGSHCVVVDRIRPFDASRLTRAELRLAAHSLVEFVDFLQRARGAHGMLTADALFATAGNELRVGALCWLTVDGAGPVSGAAAEWRACGGADDLTAAGALLCGWGDALPSAALSLARAWAGGGARAGDCSRFLALRVWARDAVVRRALALRDLAAMSSPERSAFFREMRTGARRFSPAMREHTLLPALLSASSFAKEAELVPLLLEVGESLGGDAFASAVVPVVLPLFESKDRGIRASLLAHVEKILPGMQDKVVNEKVFPNVLIGFSDSAVALRAATIVSMVHFAPRLNQGNRRRLVRELKALANDNEPSIRCNAVVCIAKIAEYIEQEYRNETLIGCFSKAAHDQFQQTRKASISAWKTCSNYFDKKIVAVSVMPAISVLCVDQCEEVKVYALKTMKQFVEMLCEGVNLEREEEKKVQQVDDNVNKETMEEEMVEEDYSDDYDGWEIDDELNDSFDEKQNEVAEPEQKLPRINEIQKESVSNLENKSVKREEQNKTEIKVEQKEIVVNEKKEPIIKMEPKQQIRNKPKIVQSKNRKERKVIIEKVSGWDDVDWDE